MAKPDVTSSDVEKAYQALSDWLYDQHNEVIGRFISDLVVYGHASMTIGANKITANGSCETLNIELADIEEETNGQD